MSPLSNARKAVRRSSTFWLDIRRCSIPHSAPSAPLAIRPWHVGPQGEGAHGSCLLVGQGEGEHPLCLDPRIGRARVEELLPRWAVARDIDLEQGLAEAGPAAR